MRVAEQKLLSYLRAFYSKEALYTFYRDISLARVFTKDLVNILWPFLLKLPNKEISVEEVDVLDY